MYADLFNGSFHGARQVLDVLNIPYTDTKEGVIEQIGKLSPKTAERLILIAYEAKRYAKECELYMRNKQNKVKSPHFAVELLYRESYDCLAELKGLI